MLGEMIGESRGKVTGVRVLPAAGGNPCMELSFQASGKLLGVESSEVGSYESVLGQDGRYHGKGQGVITTRDGDVAMWTGEGVGKPSGKGMGASWRGALFFDTTSPRLSALDGMVVVFEYEVDEGGSTHAREWQWK